MSAKVFIDTNILVYAYDNEYPTKQKLACNLLNDLILSKQAVISAQVLAEFYAVVTKKIADPLSPDDALHSVDRYMQCIDIVPVTAPIVREAMRIAQTHRISYWDAQIWAAAHLNQIGIIISEDMPGSEMIEGIRYRNPFSQ